MAFKLFVGGLPFSTTQEELEAAFAEFGTVESAVVITDHETGRSKGFGFVEMATPEEGQAAVNGLNGKEIGGRTVTVNEARPKTDRPAGNFRDSSPRRNSW